MDALAKVGEGVGADGCPPLERKSHGGLRFGDPRLNRAVGFSRLRPAKFHLLSLSGRLRTFLRGMSSRRTPGTDEAMKQDAVESHKDSYLDIAFERIGKVVVQRPWKFIAGSFLLTAVCAAGNVNFVSESRAEKQWVPDGAPSLEHKAYVDEVWGDDLRFNSFIGLPRQEGANILDAEYVRELYALDNKIKDILVDGDKIKAEQFPDLSEEEFEDFSGVWEYDPTDDEEDDDDIRRKCFEFGPVCGQNSILEVFDYDSRVISGLDNGAVIRGVNFWEKQEHVCPVSISNSESPCKFASAWVDGADDKACQKFESDTEKDDCATAIALCTWPATDSARFPPHAGVPVPRRLRGQMPRRRQLQRQRLSRRQLQPPEARQPHKLATF